MVTSLTASLDKIVQVSTRVDEEAARHRPLPEEWCVVEAVIHLGEVEPRYRARLARIASENNPQVPGIWPRPMPDPLPPLAEVVALFRQERARTTAFLSTLAPEAWERAAHHETLGPTTLRQQVQGLVDHDEEHLHQILRIVERLGDT